RANRSRILVYRLGGTQALPAATEPVLPPMNPPEQTGTEEQIAQGAGHYAVFCGNCHGGGVVQLGILPDLRRSPMIQTQEAFDAVVLEGALAATGMASFDAVFDAPDTAALRAYIVSRAHEDAATI